MYLNIFEIYECDLSQEGRVTKPSLGVENFNISTIEKLFTFKCCG